MYIGLILEQPGEMQLRNHLFRCLFQKWTVGTSCNAAGSERSLWKMPPNEFKRHNVSYRCMHWFLGHTVQDLTITVHQFHYNCTSVINWATRKPSTTASLASVSLLGIPIWALSQNSLFHSWSLWYTEPMSNRTTCKVNSTRYYREINLVQGTTTGWLL